ncbi:hypothetical protein ACFQUU_17405 [Herbaspirillum sp. GCM10030257]|uniref:hypothetical protein n=1 Tax=Herbaspirillum sp. GCM10030257 TaxID=3273393 RepID=UPI0036241A6C
MIHVLDEIVLDAAHVPAVLTLLHERYLPGCAARGMTPLNRWVSPPVAVNGEPNTLWLLWQLPSVLAYYGMRNNASTDLPGFWSAVDGLCRQRRRHVLGCADEPLQKPKESQHAE